MYLVLPKTLAAICPTYRMRYLHMFYYTLTLTDIFGFSCRFWLIKSLCNGAGDEIRTRDN